MRKGLIKKLTIILLALTISVSPFLYSKPVNANEIINGPEIVGVNVSVIDIETSHKINYITVPLQQLTLESEFCELNGIDSYSNNFGPNIDYIRPACRDSYNPNVTPSVTYQSTFNFDLNIPQHNLNVNTTTTNQILYEYEIVFNKHYVGSLKINTLWLSVNNTNVKFTSTSNITTFTFSNINLIEVIPDIYWNFPIESYLINYPHLLNNREQILLSDYNGYKYPIFKFVNNDIVSSTYMYSNNLDMTYELVLWSDVNVTNSNISNIFDYTGLIVDNTINYGVTTFNGSTIGRIYKIIFKINPNSSTGYYNIKAKRNMNLMLIIGLRSIDYFYNNMNTDFALNFGFTNKYLNSIYRIDETIYNGTVNSNNSVNNADNINNELTNSDSEYTTLENQFSSDLNTNLYNIDNSLNLNNNSSFIASANYVKNRFNRITNNMPAINLVITFSLLVGLTTLLIGKVFK